MAQWLPVATLPPQDLCDIPLVSTLRVHSHGERYSGQALCAPGSQGQPRSPTAPTSPAPEDLPNPGISRPLLNLTPGSRHVGHTCLRRKCDHINRGNYTCLPITFSDSRLKGSKHYTRSTHNPDAPSPSSPSFLAARIPSSSMSSQTTSAALYDVIGLGFGPANVAIAGAIVDKWATRDPLHVSSPLPFFSSAPAHDLIIGMLSLNVQPNSVNSIMGLSSRPYSLRSKKSFDGIPACCSPTHACKSGLYITNLRWGT